MHRISGTRLTQALAQIRLTHHPRNPRQGPKMLRIGVARGQQGDQKIDRLVINRVERHRRFKSDENGAHTVQPVDARMRNGDTLANTGRAGRLTLQQTIEHSVAINAENTGRHIGDNTEHLPFAGCADAKRHGPRIQEIADSHGLKRSLAIGRRDIVRWKTPRKRPTT